jgi:hypothetical protein
MKKKQAGLISILMICAAVGAISAYALKRFNETDQTIRFAAFKRSPDLILPSTEVMSEMQQLDKNMHVFAQPVGTDQTRVKLALFGFEPRKKVKHQAAKMEITVPRDVDYTVTFAFSSGNDRFCLINGRFFTEGSKLADGGRVERIETSRVLIRKGDASRWVLLDQSIGYEE